MDENVLKQNDKNYGFKHTRVRQEFGSDMIKIAMMNTMALNDMHHGGEHGGEGLLSGSSSPGFTSTTTFSFFGRNTAA